MERNIKVANQIKELAAEFLGRENNRTSLITVISCNTSPDLKKATIFITVLPDIKEHDALDFAKRKRAEIREFLKKKNMKLLRSGFLVLLSAISFSGISQTTIPDSLPASAMQSLKSDSRLQLHKMDYHIQVGSQFSTSTL